MNNLISDKELDRLKFEGVDEITVLVSRCNGKSIILRALNNAYKKGWNDALDKVKEKSTVAGATVDPCDMNLFEPEKNMQKGV